VDVLPGRVSRPNRVAVAVIQAPADDQREGYAATVDHRAGQGAGDVVQDPEMKNHQPGAAGLADGSGLAGPALGTIPRRWQHLGRPVISQRIQCEHGRADVPWQMPQRRTDSARLRRNPNLWN
jgi:hypothetical protein